MAINPPTGPFHVSTDGRSGSRLKSSHTDRFQQKPQNLEVGSTLTLTCFAFVILLTTTTWERVHRHADLEQEFCARATFGAGSVLD